MTLANTSDLSLSWVALDAAFAPLAAIEQPDFFFLKKFKKTKIREIELNELNLLYLLCLHTSRLDLLFSIDLIYC